MSLPASTDVIVVHIAVGSIEEARAIADYLIAQRLAACVQHYPVTSTYRWNDQVMHGEEILLVAKTVAAKLAELEAAVLGLHSYDVPEIIVLPVLGGHRPYLDWLASET